MQVTGIRAVGRMIITAIIITEMDIGTNDRDLLTVRCVVCRRPTLPIGG